MATGKGRRAVDRRLRALFDLGSIRELTDGQLLERFATGRGEGGELAFAALVERHGPMVLRVARGVLDDPDDSADAFQATFLVLVARARGLWVRDSLGPWLHQVARRTAASARANAARRWRLERHAAVDPVEDRARPDDDLARVLHEEIDRLPERYRAPVVLCDLEGRTHEQAARALGWPVGTVKSRQARARDRLRASLTRRGVAPTLAIPAAWPVRGPSIPASLVDATTLAAVRTLSTRAIAPGTAAALAREVVRAMMILRWTRTASALLAFGLAASGAGLVAQNPAQEPAGAAKPADPPRAVPPDDDPTTLRVGPGQLDLTISERGNLEPSKSLDVLCEIEGGAVLLAFKRDGLAVKKGEVVAELDSGTVRDRLVNQRITAQQAEASFKQARLVREVSESAVKEYQQGTLLTERATLQGKAGLARSGIDEARARLKRAKQARKRVDEALGRRVGPETASDVLADLALDDRIEAADLDLKKGQAELDLAQAEQAVLEKYTVEKTTKQLASQVERARADEMNRQAGLELEKSKAVKLERQVEKCTLRAPGDGLLVYPRQEGTGLPMIEEGATVRERQKVFSLANPADPFRVKAWVPAPIVDWVMPGQKVRVRVDALVGREFAGVVRSVSPMPDQTARSADNRQVYPTIVQLDERTPGLLPGMSARVEIHTGPTEALLVPVGCVFISAAGEVFVAVKGPDGAVAWRGVTLGRIYGKAVEIKAGLQPGERVVRDPDAEPKLDKKGKGRPSSPGPVPF